MQETKEKVQVVIKDWEINKADYYRSTRRFPFPVVYFLMEKSVNLLSLCLAVIEE
jgi:hypothetical protein